MPGLPASEPTEDDPPLEVLRRRLYDAAATEEDRRRYRAALEAAAAAPREQPGVAAAPTVYTSSAAPAPPAAPAAPVPPTASASPALPAASAEGSAPAIRARARSRRRGTALGAGALLGAALIATVIGVAASPPPRPAPSRPAPTGSAAPEGVRSTRAPAVLTLPPADRAGFIQPVQLRTAQTIADFLDAHPHEQPGALLLLRHPHRQQLDGIGAGTAVLQQPAHPGASGRVTVVIVVDAPAAVDWQLLHPVLKPSPQPPPRRYGERAGDQLPGVPTVATVAYRGDPPSRLQVTVPAGVRWDALVILSD